MITFVCCEPAIYHGGYFLVPNFPSYLILNQEMRWERKVSVVLPSSCSDSAASMVVSLALVKPGKVDSLFLVSHSLYLWVVKRLFFCCPGTGYIKHLRRSFHVLSSCLTAKWYTIAEAFHNTQQTYHGGFWVLHA